ncbi:MAG: 2,3-bisphosphoglycerate-independent phosphoglycerate mutase [Psychroserpens sp.]|jgi:2,3-bisphosphoglycerate-independent phosphoglycerate mutase
MNKAALIILDGWGIGKKDHTDGVFMANTPFIDELQANCPNSTLITYGEDVGLPKGQMGNSEVGHMNIGAGRVVFQDLVRINNSIKNEKFKENKVLVECVKKALETNSKIHLIGLVSKGGVHSSQDHITAISNVCGNLGIKEGKLFLHAITDGRDCDPNSGLSFISELENNNKNNPLKIASVIGRYYAMDRDNRWERVKLAYDLFVRGIGEKEKTAHRAIAKSYEDNITDEFIKPVVICNDSNQPLAIIEKGDVVLCFNFRTDRCREITQVLSQQANVEFDMQPLDLHFVTMTNYNKSFKNINVMFDKDELKNTLGEVVSAQKRSQLRIAETEKYPHVSFFFNGGREAPFLLENRIMIPSPGIATYDLKPEMSAQKVTDNVIKEIKSSAPDFICLNFANGDMVGHTGVPDAIVKACETVDNCLSEIVKVGKESGYSFVIIADHGNADKMMNPDGSANTAHTLNLVPCILVSNKFNSIQPGRLADIAPTILKIMNLPQPIEMTGKSLI